MRIAARTLGGLAAVLCLGLGGPSGGASAQTLALWANNGQDKVRQDELRLSEGRKVDNSVWNGKTVKLFGAGNETVTFCLVLEAPGKDLTDVRVAFNSLAGPGGARIASRQADRRALFDYVGRDIELFFVRYLQIKGVSRLLYDPSYDERHVPQSLRLPYADPEKGWHRTPGRFEDRPGANKFYPDIAVPIEAVGAFSVAKGSSQLVWVDVYIPRKSPPGVYRGVVTVSTAETGRRTVPVELQVLPFALPDRPTAKTMLYYSDEDIFDRYYGHKWPYDRSPGESDRQYLQTVVHNHHKQAHRHRIALIDDGVSIQPERTGNVRINSQTEIWLPILDGRLFTPQHGYAGPGVGVGNGVYSIGTYGSWQGLWKPIDREAIWKHTDILVNWFKQHAPDTEIFLYLKDEPKAQAWPDVEQWAAWVDENPGPGRALPTLVTSYLPKLREAMPSVDIGFLGWGDPAAWEPALKAWRAQGKACWAYNGTRPSTGSFATEDDGVALRSLGWTHYKMQVGRWFYWQSTHYKNTSHAKLETDVFQTAATFGRIGETPHAKYGVTGSNYSNGDGVLFYPGTEKRFPEQNYGLDGPIASLRLKLWRRGLQDMEYLTMAAKVSPEQVDALVRRMVPRVLWEVGVTEPADPSYVHADISWSTDPDVWEQARRELSGIIVRRRAK